MSDQHIAAKDRDHKVAQKLAEGVQADRGSAESPTENLAVSYGDSTPDAGSVANEQDRGYTADLLREVAERAQEQTATPGTGDDALVLDWLAFDGEMYRVTIERIEL